MAIVRTYYTCPTCQRMHETVKEATICRNRHPIRGQNWAVGKYKMVRISERCHPDGMYGLNWALREADLSDNIEERRKQLAEINNGVNQR